MKLYTYFRSSTAFRTRIALNLKGLQYEAAYVHLAKGEHRERAYAAVNPQLLVPTLEDAGARLGQSLAIIEYLEETHPRPALLPKDAPGRARVRSIALLMACEIHPIANLRVLQHLRKQLGQNEDQVNGWARHWISDGLAKVEAELAGDARTGKHCHGDAPGMADCCLVPQVFSAQRFKADLAPYPTVMRVFEACMALEAFDRAQPAKQPDAE